MKKIQIFFTGIALGMLSWGAAHVASGKFELFDSDTGFWVAEVILVIATLLAGIKFGVGKSLLLVFGEYLGLNTYVYLFGGAEARSWILLSLFTTLMLLVYPALAGLIGGAIRYLRAKKHISSGAF